MVFSFYVHLYKISLHSSLHRVFNFIETEVKSIGPNSSNGEPSDKAAVKLNHLHSIHLSDVGFHYSSRVGDPVLKGITMTFSMKCHQLTAVVGPSGSGKSTILSIISGLYTPSNGMLLFNDIDSTKLAASCIRNHIGVVEQKCGLLSGSIRFNIAYGKVNILRHISL